MTLSDISLLIRKILIGVFVALIPFLILFFGLHLTQQLLHTPASTNASFHQTW